MQESQSTVRRTVLVDDPALFPRLSSQLVGEMFRPRFDMPVTGKNTDSGKDANQVDVEAGISTKPVDSGLSKTFSSDSASETAFADFVHDSSKHDKKGHHTEHHAKEMASLILGLERTLFAALNNAWLLSAGGIGLMTVGQDDDRALLGGSIILGLGICCAAMAYGFHLVRVSQLTRGVAYPSAHTLLWATIIACLTVTVLSLEMYFGILYPYLQRSAAVTVTNTVTP